MVWDQVKHQFTCFSFSQKTKTIEYHESRASLFVIQSLIITDYRQACFYTVDPPTSIFQACVCLKIGRCQRYLVES